MSVIWLLGPVAGIPGRSQVEEEQLMALRTVGTEATSRDVD